MNTHESYVSLETARLLKQAGFDWEVWAYWVNNYANGEMKQKRPFENRAVPFDYNNEPGVKYPKGNMLSAPTLAVAQRWVREVKKRNVIVSYMPSWQYAQRYHAYIAELNMNVGESECDNYEAALEAGIQKCLTLMLE